jgi:hypothetical protein
MMFNKRIALSLSLIAGLSLVAVEPVLATQDGQSDSKLLPAITENFGPERSAPRDVSERIILSLLHNGLTIKDGKLIVDPKKALTETRDNLYKGITYKFLDKAVLEALQKAGQFTNDKKTTYKTYVSPLVGDGLDVIFRGVKYLNDDSKEQTVTAYVKNDLAPYLVKKKIVWLTMFAVRKALEQNEQGRKLLALYEIAQLIPFIGIELEDAPKTILGFLYDKGLENGKKIVQKFVIPKFKSLQNHYQVA